ncbi:Ca-activated chloride channel family protein [Melghirimyces profundicolus]|uniref:Ca-activated chloride channel family protein n=1 Tax=Melghirimyces profundicolus TaxID=1242148 RepID=A0A2T6BGV6_9BACL|nr:Ca-activated chloride channel family protein [Melghirimyces profundicolus]
MLYRKRWALFIPIIIVAFFFSGCGNHEQDSKADPDSKDEKVPQAAKGVKGMLTEGPGKFSGEKFDEKEIKQTVQKWPKGLSAEEAYNRLVYLLAEDYKTYVDQFDSLSTDFQLNDTPDAGKTTEGKTSHTLNVAVLVDSSGSMAGKVNGQTKMDLAKRSVKNFVSKLPEGANVSLTVYGHKGSNSESDKEMSCKSIEEVYTLAPYKESSFKASLNEFKSAGWTPLAASIHSVKDIFEEGTKEDQKPTNVVYVVSDGIETCDGNPVKEAKQLNRSNIKAVINIIGFDVDNQGQKALKEVAEAGGGTYATVNSSAELDNQFKTEQNRIKSEWRKWALQNHGDVSEQYFDKVGELSDISDGMQKLQQQEEDRFRLVMDKYLSDHLEEYGDLNQLVNDRSKKIKSYRIDRRQEIKKEISKSYREAKRKIRDRDVD